MQYGVILVSVKLKSHTINICLLLESVSGFALYKVCVMCMWVYSSPLLIRPPICQDIVATIETWPLSRMRNKYIHSSSSKNLRPHKRGWPLLRVATKRASAVYAVTVEAGSMCDWPGRSLFRCDLRSGVIFIQVLSSFRCYLRSGVLLELFPSPGGVPRLPVWSVLRRSPPCHRTTP